jgi:hypothetical protein
VVAVVFGALPPEINSGLMYAGAGSGSLVAAAAAWEGLASQLGSAATSYRSVVADLTGGPWVGPSSVSMAAAAAPYVAWMTTTAAQAEQTASQLGSAIAAYETAFAATVPPPLIAANRALLAALVATNIVTGCGWRRHPPPPTTNPAGTACLPSSTSGGAADCRSARCGGTRTRAYLGICIPEFPNLFMMYGPNTNLGHGGSYILIAECQIRYILDLLCKMIERGIGAVECRPDVHDDYNRRVDEAHAKMIWARPGITNYYKNARGRVVTNSPWRHVDYWRMTHESDLSGFVVEGAVVPSAGPEVASK